MKKRELVLTKYGISNARQRELRAFCEQLPEWKQFLSEHKNTVESSRYRDVPGKTMGAISDKTADLAVKRANLQEKIRLIEDTAKEIDPKLWKYIIDSVCYNKPFYKLNVPISQSAFYDRRRYFFLLLDYRKN